MTNFLLVLVGWLYNIKSPESSSQHFTSPSPFTTHDFDRACRAVTRKRCATSGGGGPIRGTPIPRSISPWYRPSLHWIPLKKKNMNLLLSMEAEKGTGVSFQGLTFGLTLVLPTSCSAQDAQEGKGIINNINIHSSKYRLKRNDNNNNNNNNNNNIDFRIDFNIHGNQVCKP